MLRQRVQNGGFVYMAILAFLSGATVLICAQQLLLGMSLEDLLGEGLLTALTFKPGEIHGSLLNSTGVARASSKKLLRTLAVEISALHESHTNRLVALNDSLADLSSSLTKMREDEVPSLAEALDGQKAVLTEQRQMIRRQAALLEAQANQMHLIKQELTLARGQQHQTLQHNLLLHGDPRHWRQRTFTQHSTYGFIKFSGYRTSAAQFAALGLAALELREARTLQGCRWHGNDGRVLEGELKLLYQNEHHRLRYEVVVAMCDLREATGLEGGFLVGTIDDEQMVFLAEERNPVVDPGPPFEHQLTYCSPPLYGSLDGRAMWEWLEYHRAIMGFDHFILYDVQALQPDVVAYLRDYIDLGWIDLTDFAMAQSYNSWLWAQGLAILDCMYRTRTTSRWTAMLDFDEYLEAVAPHTLASLLTKYEHKAWLTHGVVWWGLQMCNKRSGDLFAIERVVYHWPKDYCMDHDEKPEEFPDTNYCLDYHGHRKYILNPRKVYLANIHEVLIPADTGVNLHLGKELRHHHYQGVNVRGRYYHHNTFCNETFGDEEEVKWWVKDYRMANTVERIRKCPIRDRSCMLQIP